MAYIKIHMILPFGKAVYVVGSCQELGNWNVAESLRLEWTEVYMHLSRDIYGVAHVSCALARTSNIST